jgi:hypothetical protein
VRGERGGNGLQLVSYRGVLTPKLASLRSPERGFAADFHFFRGRMENSVW